MQNMGPANTNRGFGESQQDLASGSCANEGKWFVHLPKSFNSSKNRLNANTGAYSIAPQICGRVSTDRKLTLPQIHRAIEQLVPQILPEAA